MKMKITVDSDISEKICMCTHNLLSHAIEQSYYCLMPKCECPRFRPSGCYPFLETKTAEEITWYVGGPA